MIFSFSGRGWFFPTPPYVFSMIVIVVSPAEKVNRVKIVTPPFPESTSLFVWHTHSEDFPFWENPHY